MSDDGYGGGGGGGGGDDFDYDGPGFNEDAFVRWITPCSFFGRTNFF